MRVARLTPRSFRNLADAPIALGPGLTVLHGPNGAGKTNVLEAIFFALTGRSCRTRREREAIAFGAGLARVEARLEPDPGEDGDPLVMMASVSSGEARRRLVDGSPAQPGDDLRRPAISVFMPDRLALVKGPPAPRRAHLDRLVAALHPARAELAREYSRALAQRNSLLGRVRRGGDPAALGAWDQALAERAVPLVAARAEAAAALREPFAAAAEELGLAGGGTIDYRPRTAELDAAGIGAELEARRESDLARGFTGFGPHRDDVEIAFGGRSLRRYGSQGQQRLGLLALLFSEREALRAERRRLPLLLLDDVMSELDPDRRTRLVAMLEDGGQTLITATEIEHVPAAAAGLAIAAGVATAETLR
ncbi:MAG TPA: DNA replication and repair protein RecF [Solirubrobacterales bacterium]|nr:DNA replication and repair protein RecF [Solirubrobacterales bacterium]